STLPLEKKVLHCISFYAAAQLPAIFRLLPFSEPSTLDAWLERNGWAAFEHTLVLRCSLADPKESRHSNELVTIIESPAWEPLVAQLLDIAPDALPRFIERAAGYPLPHAGALIRRDGEVVACGLLKLEDDHAGLFALKTAAVWRRRALGRAALERRVRIATAESCTGGLVAGAMTAVAGSSDWFDSGFITYSNEAKIGQLAVPPRTIEQFGAVSEETALSMAQGALGAT